MKVGIKSNGNEVKTFSPTTGLLKRRLQKNMNNLNVLIKIPNVQENFLFDEVECCLISLWSHCIKYFLHSLNQF